MTSRLRASDALIGVVTLCFAIVLFIVGWLRYRVFRAQIDLGLFTQVISSPFSGFSSTAEGGVSHFAVHFSPILYLASPFLLLFRSPLALVAVQAVLSALTIPAFFLIAKRHMPVPLAMLAALTVFTYPPLISMTVGDFHELAFATPVLLWLAWALETRRYRIASVLAALSLAIKEDVTLVLAASAVAIALWARRRNDARLDRFARVFALAAVATFALFALVIRPALSAHGATGPLPYYGHYYDWTFHGATPHGYAPLESPIRSSYLEGVFGPLLVLPLLTPAIVLALPGLLEVLASHEAITIDLSTHYVACWLPYVLYAFALGLARVGRRTKIAAYVLVVGTIATSLWIDINASPANFWYQIYRLPNARDARLETTLQALPHDATIASDLWIFAHLGLHPHATIDPIGASILVVDRTCDTDFCKRRIFPAARDALARRSMRVAQMGDGIEIYTAIH